MAGFNGIDTAIAVSYLGELFQQYRRANALVRLMGGMGNVRRTASVDFPIGAFYVLPNPSQPARLEGQVAPAPNNVTVAQTTNNVQIFQETVSLTYLAQSENAVGGVVPIPQGTANGPLQNPRAPEFQVQRAIEKVQQDLNYSCLNGVYSAPADASVTALGTRGVLTALQTNVVDESGQTASNITAAVYRSYVMAALASMVAQNGYQIGNDFFALCGTTQYANIVNAWSTQATVFAQPEGVVLGLMVRKIVTTFGTLNLVLEPDVPANQLAILYAPVLGLIGLEVPGKGIFFEEPLYKAGSSEQTQLYGQMGMDHGPEYYHGLLKLPAGVVVSA